MSKQVQTLTRYAIQYETKRDFSKSLHSKQNKRFLATATALNTNETRAVSQYQVRKVRTCVLGSSDFASSTQECELLRTGGHKSGNSANGTAVYLITSVSSPKLSTLYYNTTKYDIKHHCLLLFSCKHINSRKNVVQGTYMHYSANKILYQTALPLFCFI